MKFNIDNIRIDPSIVCNRLPGSDNLAMCAAMIGMAHKLGMKVITEGVKTPAQPDLPKAAGGKHGQDFMF